MRLVLPAVLSLTACGSMSEASQSDLDAALDRIEQLEAQVAELQGQEGFDASPIEERLDQLEGAKVVGLIDEPLTIQVPGDHADLAEAMVWLQGYSLAAPVTIQVADGTYEHGNEGIGLGHRDGARLRIVGNEGDPSQVVLSFNGGVDGLYLTRARAVNAFSGFTVRGTNMEDGAAGVWVSESAAFRCRGPLVVEGFTVGVLAAHNSSIRCDGLTARDNQNEGALAMRGSSIQVRNGLAENNGGHGFAAYHSSSADFGGSTSRENGERGWGSGFIAFHASALNADDTVSTRNASHGYEVHGASAMDVHRAEAVSNGETGLHASFTSTLNAGEGTTSNSNRQGVGAYSGSAISTWGGIEVRNNTEEGIQAGGTSFVDLTEVTVRDSGMFGVNAYWGSFIFMDGATTASGHTYDTNLTPSSDPTATSFVYQD